LMVAERLSLRSVWLTHFSFQNISGRGSIHPAVSSIYIL
jgi:hypothetical protein